MRRKELLENIKYGVLHVHDEIFPDIHVDEIIHEEDMFINKALDKYLQYINYTENQDKYNLKYCFKTTITDLNDFYSYQDKKLDIIKDNQRLCEIEHDVNMHIYDEVMLCQKKVNRLFLINTFTVYALAFLLIFAVTELTHVLHFNTLLGTTVLAFVLALIKVFIDKKYLEIVRVRVGWKAYRLAIYRSLAFYFTSVIVLNHYDHHDMNEIDNDKLKEFQLNVQNVVDMLFKDIIFSKTDD